MGDNSNLNFDFENFSLNCTTWSLSQACICVVQEFVTNLAVYTQNLGLPLSGSKNGELTWLAKFDFVGLPLLL